MSTWAAGKGINGAETYLLKPCRLGEERLHPVVACTRHRHSHVRAIRAHHHRHCHHHNYHNKLAITRSLDLKSSKRQHSILPWPYDKKKKNSTISAIWWFNVQLENVKCLKTSQAKYFTASSVPVNQIRGFLSHLLTDVHRGLIHSACNALRFLKVNSNLLWFPLWPVILHC